MAKRFHEKTVEAMDAKKTKLIGENSESGELGSARKKAEQAIIDDDPTSPINQHKKLVQEKEAELNNMALQAKDKNNKGQRTKVDNAGAREWEKPPGKLIKEQVYFSDVMAYRTKQVATKEKELGQTQKDLD